MIFYTLGSVTSVLFPVHPRPGDNLTKNARNARTEGRVSLSIIIRNIGGSGWGAALGPGYSSFLLVYLHFDWSTEYVLYVCSGLVRTEKCLYS